MGSSRPRSGPSSRRYGERSVAFAELLERIGLEAFAVATDDRAPAEIAREVVARWRDDVAGDGR